MDGGGREHGTLSAMRRDGAARDLPGRFLRLVPKPVRRAGRHAVRGSIAMFEGRVAAPKRAVPLLVLGVLGPTLLYGAALSGRGSDWIDASAASLGLAIADVRIEGAVETAAPAIATAMGVGSVRSLPAIATGAGRDAVISLPWIEDAQVVKRYPGTLAVTVSERQAVALWRVGSRTLLIDAEGAPIVDADGRALPLLVGEGADAAVADGLAIFAAVPEVTPSIKALVRVAARRWDLVTHRNVVVMLPAEAPERALARLARLHREQAVLEKDLAAIDLRVPDRVALRLSPEAAERRAEAVAQAEKDRKDARKQREVAL